VIDFWGTWCPGCVETLPDFIALSRDTAWRPVAFVTINCEKRDWGQGDPRERVRALMREKGWSFPVVQDTTTRTQEAFGVKAFPSIVVIDRAGRMRFLDLGDPPGHPMLREQLAMLLAERPARRRR
jgi:thiol-disulfide isomerase/thioredoxin